MENRWHSAKSVSGFPSFGVFTCWLVHCINTSYFLLHLPLQKFRFLGIIYCRFPGYLSLPAPGSESIVNLMVLAVPDHAAVDIRQRQHDTQQDHSHQHGRHQHHDRRFLVSDPEERHEKFFESRNNLSEVDLGREKECHRLHFSGILKQSRFHGFHTIFKLNY